jgi:3-oxoacyl-(acyl-carrier-protein) synthase
MRLAIAGRGWVTPLGSDVEQVWQRLRAGEQACVGQIASEANDHSYAVFRVPSETLNLPPHPRLRRSSAISKFAASAGLGALREAEVDMTPEIAARTALVFAISNGGVVYTRRFYDDVVTTGARGASPLLFPETVFNAPASHLAAILGVTGASYTVVGDGAVSVFAVKMAEDLMQNEALDYCLVVAAEEADWLLCDAYRKWRLLRSAPPIEPFHSPPRGMILSEGAGAVLLARSGNLKIERVALGRNFRRRADASAVIEGVLNELSAPTDPSILVGSANGTFIDNAERSAIAKHCPQSAVYTAKPALGESVGASGMWQIICAAEALRTRSIPPLLHAPPDVRTSAAGEFTSAVVSVSGMNQQVGGLRLSLG